METTPYQIRSGSHIRSLPLSLSLSLFAAGDGDPHSEFTTRVVSSLRVMVTRVGSSLRVMVTRVGSSLWVMVTRIVSSLRVMVTRVVRGSGGVSIKKSDFFLLTTSYKIKEDTQFWTPSLENISRKKGNTLSWESFSEFWGFYPVLFSLTH